MHVYVYIYILNFSLKNKPVSEQTCDIVKQLIYISLRLMFIWKDAVNKCAMYVFLFRNKMNGFDK